MPSTPGNGGCDQSRTSVRLAWRDWSRTNEALGVCSRDATANRLIVDSVDHGIRHQYHRRRKLTPRRHSSSYCYLLARATRRVHRTGKRKAGLLTCCPDARLLLFVALLVALQPRISLSFARAGSIVRAL